MNLNHITSKLAGLLLLVLLLGVQSCKIDELSDPNGPSILEVENNATLEDMILVAVGIESSARVDIGFYIEGVGVFGRDFYRLTNTDPRYTTDLPGANGAILDDNTFYTTRPYGARYACIRNCYILEHAVQNNTSGVTQAQKNGFLGYAKTMQAYQLLLVANMQYCSGIRVDTEDPENLGGFVGEGDINPAYAAVESLLNEGRELLSVGEFAFPLSSGFAAIGTDAEDFMKFNRAIAARAAIYQGRKTEALTYLAAAAPFFNSDGGYAATIDHVYSNGSGDITNPVFLVLDGPDNDCVQKDWLIDAEPGDLRAAEGNKYQTRSSTLVIPGTGLSGDQDVSLWPDSESPISMIRNEELALIYAEANIGSDNTEAARVLDQIRDAAGLPAATYANNPPLDAELVDQMLHERRYSLFAEGHRWVDMRRYDRLDELPLDSPDHQIHVCYPRPANETGG